jgi:excisionase family DNA binding protein
MQVESVREEVSVAGGAPTSPALMTVPEAANYLRIGRSKLYQLVAAGTLPSVRIGSVLRIPRAGLDAWIEGQTTGGPVLHSDL